MFKEKLKNIKIKNTKTELINQTDIINKELYNYLMTCTEYKKDSIIFIESFHKIISNQTNINVVNLNNDIFKHVNKEYIIQAIKICKHCLKKARKGCCPLYKHTDRTVKKIVKNIEFIIHKET